MKNLAFVETFDGKCNLIIIIVFLHTFSNESNRLLNCDHVLTDQEVCRGGSFWQFQKQGAHCRHSAWRTSWFRALLQLTTAGTVRVQKPNFSHFKGNTMTATNTTPPKKIKQPKQCSAVQANGPMTRGSPLGKAAVQNGHGNADVYLLLTGSLGAGSLTSVGSTPQISRAYWAMVRSLENFPDAAIFIRHLWAHFSWSCVDRCWK